MGAAVTKAEQAPEDPAGATGTPADARLAAAAHTLLQWDCSRGPDAGIWDAEAACANARLLSAVDEILHLKEMHAFPMASPARRRMDGALGVAMSRLVDEFLLLRVWDASRLQGTDGLLFAVEKLSVTLQASGGGVWPAFPTGSSASSGAFSACASDELYASDRSLSSWPDAVTVVVDGAFSDELDLIWPASLAVLHEIALRVIRAGYTKELLQTFTRASCHVLDRFLSILQLDRPFFDANRVNFEDAEWWTTEDMVKRWILATKLVVKALVVMQGQLRARKCGAFDRFKDDYFMAIAKQSIVVLLKFADGFTSTESPEKLIYVLEMYEVLSNSAPGLLPLFTGQNAELISRQLPLVLTKLARALRAAAGGLIAKIRADGSHASGAAATHGVGVHPLARDAMTCVELLAPHRAALDLVLAAGGEDDERGAAAGGAERVTSFGGLVAELIAGVERNLEEKSALAFADGSPSQHLYLANNTGFVLSRAADADVLSLLGDDWAARRRSRLQRHTAGYLRSSWGPVVACLETETAVRGSSGKPAKALAKFNAAFEKMHVSEVVPDPALREALRKAVADMVVPVYGAFLQKHMKLGKSVRYTANDVAQALSGLFEGDV